MENYILIKSSNKDDYFKIDKEDYEKVKDYCWCSSHGYAVASNKCEENEFVRMHRIIMECGENEDFLVVDHINHDTTDNRKENLRIVTDTQNNWNSCNTIMLVLTMIKPKINGKFVFIIIYNALI